MQRGLGHTIAIAMAAVLIVLGITAGITYAVVYGPKQIHVTAHDLDAIEINGTRFENVTKTSESRTSKKQ
jgi:hypothetical protein